MPKALVRSSALVLLVLFALASGRVVHAATVSNGTFETGDLTGWTLGPLTGSGKWYVYSGTSSPASAHPITAPPQGNYAATTDQTGPTAAIMYQDLVLEPNATHTLSFVLYYTNFFSAFDTPPALDLSIYPNQQYRVDLISPTASLTSVAATDVLMNLYQTKVGDPLTKAPTTLSFNLSAFAGQTVRLRFAMVDTENFFLASVDNVQLVSTFPTPQAQSAILPTGPLGGVQSSGCGSVTVSTSSPATASTTLSTTGVLPAGVGPGTTLYLTAVPCTGSAFQGWNGGPCAGTTTNPCQLNIISGVLPTITANFSP